MTSWILSLSFAILNLASVERNEKITKIWISREWKELQMKWKYIFHSFWRAFIWWKKKLADRNFEKITIFQIVDIILDFSNQINFELENINDPEWHVFFYFEMSISVTFPVKLVWRQLKKFWSKNNFQFLKRISEKVCKWCIIIANIHKDIFACLFSIHHIIISLSCHEQVCLSGLTYYNKFIMS